jgi:shikimate kinase
MAPNKRVAGASNIVLIGMPGAGKSTLGVLLAKQTAKSFIDTDLLIQEHEGKTLQSIVDQQGYLVLREIEAQVLEGLSVTNTVIATGGSAVYSDRAMANLKRNGLCCYLRLSLPSVERRVYNLGSRGIAAAAGQPLADIYEERQPLYERYADVTINCDHKTIDQVLVELLDAVQLS